MSISFNFMLIFVILLYSDLVGRSGTENAEFHTWITNQEDWRRTVMDDGVKNAWKVGFIFISYFLSKKNSNLRYFKFSVKIYKSFKFSWQISLTNKDPQYAHFWNIVFLKYFFPDTWCVWGWCSSWRCAFRPSSSCRPIKQMSTCRGSTSFPESGTPLIGWFLLRHHFFF